MNVYKIYQVKRNQIWGFFVFWLFGGFFFPNEIACLNGSHIRSLFQSIVISKPDNWKLPYSDKHE